MLIVRKYMLLKNKTGCFTSLTQKKDFQLVNYYNTKTHLWYMDK